MIAAGLEAEVESLLNHQSLNALKTVGYAEFFNFFNKENKCTYARNNSLVKQHTRQYAKGK
jgi:tRNA dimethylallyltransferase